MEGGTNRYYRYDKNSNRCSTSSTITDCSDVAYEYDNADRLTTATTDPRYANLKYDADPVTGSPLPVAHGNLTHMGNTVVTYDARDHATTIADGTTKVQETLAPSGRVLERKVTEVATGNVVEWKVFGYDGPGDSPAYEQTTGASGPTWANPLRFSEDWTQVWRAEKWTTSTSGTATLGINANRGEFYVSGGSDARAMAITPASGDGEVALTFAWSDLANRSGFRIGLRGCSAQPTCPGPSMNFGYRVDVVSDQSTVSVRRIVNGSHTTLPGGTFSYTKTAGQKYRIRVRLQGYTISVKLWKAGDPEPAGWSLVVTDGDTVNQIGGTGKLHLHHNGTSGARSVYVDDLVYTDFTRVRKTYLGGGGGLAVIDSNGEPTYTHPNAHGDLAGSTDITGAYTAIAAVDEYGKGTAPAGRLGWLGNHQRFTAHNGNSLMRMGVRLYDPNIGRLLSVDPIEGGSANNYDYVAGDPVNNMDLNGEACWTGVGGCPGRRRS
ncbi:MAG: RHS repeat-associated core domain-containing protein [Acidimicrobiia bacterium]